MAEYSFTVKGIGLEHGFTCIDCVKQILNSITEQKGVVFVTYSNVQKNFKVSITIDNQKKAMNVLAKSVNKAGKIINKTIEIIDFKLI